ncbi:MAG: NosD domain-containing protein [Methanosarcinaceae archaeon]|nr:NosD domain-containing protein [Methanosarcinaceae archaeon]
MLPILFFIGAASIPAAGKTISVDDSGGANYTTIQEAVSSADDGDLILIYPGIYAENLKVYRELNLVSAAGPKSTFIISNDPDADVLYVTADNVRIDGFTVLGLLSDTGSISENKWPDGPSGVFLDGANNCELTNNTFAINDIGISLQDSNNSNLHKNIAVRNYWDGIDLLNSNGCKLYQNLVAGNGRGIFIGNSTNSSLLSSSVLANNEGINLQASRDCFLEGNRICGNELGIYVEEAKNNTLKNNILETNFIGVILKEAEENLFYENHFASREQNAIDYGTNIWNSSVGNFWNDYSGKDADKDGIGDTPYIINESTGSFDYRPLIGYSVLSSGSPEHNFTGNFSLSFPLRT